MFSVTTVLRLHGMTAKLDHGSGLFTALVYDVIWADTGPKTDNHYRHSETRGDSQSVERLGNRERSAESP